MYKTVIKKRKCGEYRETKKLYLKNKRERSKKREKEREKKKKEVV